MYGICMIVSAHVRLSSPLLGLANGLCSMHRLSRLPHNECQCCQENSLRVQYLSRPTSMDIGEYQSLCYQTFKLKLIRKMLSSS